jgi:hypothetical protein
MVKHPDFTHLGIRKDRRGGFADKRGLPPRPQ